MNRYNPTERIGVNAVEQVVVQALGWIFREQPIADMGIDAHIELVDEQPTGQLIGIQIKTGKGNFYEGSDAYVYYGSQAHLEYWTSHCLPVVLIAHFPDSGETLWTLMNRSTVEPTEKAWKITIPKTSVFDARAKAALTEAFAGSPREQRSRRLSIDEPLMRHVQMGNRVSVDLENWYNKSLGRSTVQVFVYDENGDETVAREWFALFTVRDMKQLAETIFPWATARIDHDFYDEHSEFEDTVEDRLRRATDFDNGITPYVTDPDDVYPYSDAAGEVESYRLRLTLNDLGKAFLTVSDYINSDV